MIREYLQILTSVRVTHARTVDSALMKSMATPAFASQDIQALTAKQVRISATF